LCGIAGFIGQSKLPDVTCEIITHVFSRTEVRGIDAAGFWGVDAEGNVLYHKEPCRSSELVKKDAWKEVITRPLDLLLVHARAASQGVGEPYINRNNHPFLSTDGSLGLIHNGRITEYETLRNKYQVLSDCDSEILLRIIEAGEDYNDSDFPTMEPPLSSRFMGIRDVFSLVSHGHMAVALGERLDDGRRRLWLFRNRHRSLWAVDLRHNLGQVFFCSTPEIWREALSVCKPFRKQKLIEIPEEEVWFFEIGEKKQAEGVTRYQVHKELVCGELAEGKPRPITLRTKKAVLTKLNEEDELPSVKKKEKRSGPYPLTDLETCCMHISDSLRRIQTLAFAMEKDGSMTDQEWSAIIESVNIIKSDLDGTLRIMER
jgi:hypothetical protein